MLLFDIVACWMLFVVGCWILLVFWLFGWLVVLAVVNCCLLFVAAAVVQSLNPRRSGDDGHDHQNLLPSGNLGNLESDFQPLNKKNGPFFSGLTWKKWLVRRVNTLVANRNREV